jgi:putative DNA primase/helicase
MTDLQQNALEEAQRELDEARVKANGKAASLPTIQVKPGHLDHLATEAEKVLIDSGAPFYVRGGKIVRPIVEEVDAAKGHKAMAARLTAVAPDVMVDHMARNAVWVRHSRREDKFFPTDPPGIVARIVLSREGEWGFPNLAGVITTPTMRPDGSIVDKPGFDPVTRLLLMQPPKLPEIGDTEAAAREALALLVDLMADFPFVDAASRAVALSELITPIVRGAMPVAPLHVNRAPSAGSGKSFLVDVTSTIATGQRCPVIAAGRTEEETEKRLGAALLAGYPLISIDNLNGELGGDALCQLVERPRVAIRPLGVSELVTIEARATVFCTGNNVQPTGDIVRRVIVCSLDPNLERPELRTFNADPIATVLADRGKYIAAALTIVHAWLKTGEPDPLPPLASFEAWSHTVRSALVWLGESDPVETMETARDEDPELEQFRAVITAWKDAVGFNEGLTAGELKSKAEATETTYDPDNPYKHESEVKNPDLHQALVEVAGGTRAQICPMALGRFLSRHNGKISLGIKLVGILNRKRKQKEWVLRIGG